MAGYLRRTGSGESRVRLRAMYNDLEREVPAKTAPPARRVVGMGGDLWIEMFARGPGETVTWFVTSPREGTVRATITVDDQTTLLGGTEGQAVLLRPNELGVEIVEVRAVRRGLWNDHG